MAERIDEGLACLIALARDTILPDHAPKTSMVSNPPAVEIRPIRQIAQLKAVEDMQQKIWGCSDREIVPALVMIPLLEVGGVLLGAYSGDELVGFVFGFPGAESGRLIIHSDMLAVKGEYRSHGVGHKLKLAQRDFALAKGISEITWTFDPLQSRNAHLNFARLGVIAEQYKINYYGETSSFLHRTGTDRLWVRWLLNSDRVKRRITGAANLEPSLEDVPSLVRVGEELEPVASGLEPEQAILKVEIPDDINSLLEQDVDLAIRWREVMRSAFTTALAANYFVKDFYRLTRNSRGLGVYLLASKSKPAVWDCNSTT